MGRSSSKREEIYAFLKDYIASHGYPPTTREIMAGVGLRSTASVHYHLSELSRSGAIEMDGGKNRAISLGAEAAPQGVPLVGVVTAGQPILAVENIEGYVPWEAEAGCFALRVRGDSMIEAGIFDGDKVVVRPQQTAENGEIVVALLGDSATVKRLRRRSGEVWLMPENPAYDPIDGREAGELGFCQMPGQLRAARAMLHYGEEPPICANYGTGAVFFSGCTLRCRYCQNGVISTGGAGEALTPEALRETFLRLIDEGAQSIDLVTPTHFLPSILPALTPRLPVPVIYNCGGYESVETLRELEGLIDIYLPDYKYADPELAARLSGARDYPAVAAAALREMYRQVGGTELNEDGQMMQGMLVRHLVLPGFLSNTLAALDTIAALFPARDVSVSLMSQYVPMGKLPAPLDRGITREEYDGALSWMELCGLTGYWQDFSSATTEYLPDFGDKGLLYSG